jgi:hypothetical protein
MTVQPSPGDEPDAPSATPNGPDSLIGLLSEVSRNSEQTNNFNKIVEPWARACFALAVAVIFALIFGVCAVIFLANKGVHGAGAPWALGVSGLTIMGGGTAAVVRFCRWIRRRRKRGRPARHAHVGEKTKPQLPQEHRRQAPQ